jgi:hypothetical protein
LDWQVPQWPVLSQMLLQQSVPFAQAPALVMHVLHCPDVSQMPLQQSVDCAHAPALP